MSRTNREPRRLALEALEGRALLSVAPMLAQSALARRNIVHTQVVGVAPIQANSIAIPTPAEAARARFIAQYKGRYAIGAPRFTDQSATYYFTGAGTSNQFLHGNMQMSVYTFNDGSPASGAASLPVKNISNTGNDLEITLQNATAYDSKGRPTQFAWFVNGGGGTYTNASGSGLLTVIYQPDARHPARTRETGKVGLIFQGSVYTTGINNITR